MVFVEDVAVREAVVAGEELLAVAEAALFAFACDEDPRNALHFEPTMTGFRGGKGAVGANVGAAAWTTLVWAVVGVTVPNNDLGPKGTGLDAEGRIPKGFEIVGSGLGVDKLGFVC